MITEILTRFNGVWLLRHLMMPGSASVSLFIQNAIPSGANFSMGVPIFEKKPFKMTGFHAKNNASASMLTWLQIISQPG